MTILRPYPTVAISLVALTASMAAPVHAQTREETPGEDREVIIVTGKKREAALQDVTDSVAVYTNEDLRNSTFTEVADLLQFTPNVQNTVSGEGEFAIRGINFRGENLSLTSNLGSFYVDGIFQSTLGIEGGPAGVFDVAQVEIFRGVQSTVQGRNALAGTIHVRTRDPEFRWGASGRGEIAEFDTWRVGLAVNGELMEDQVAVRASIEEFETDGFLTNPAAGIDNVDFDDSATRRVKLLVEPEALPGFSALATYVSSDGIAGTGFGTNVANGPDFFARQTRPDITNPGLLLIETESFALELRQELTADLNLELLVTRSDASERSEPRFEAFDLDTFFDFATDEEEVTTAELRAIYSGDRLQLLGGLYFFEQDRLRTRDLGLPQSNIFFVEGTEQRIDNLAAFFDGEFSLTDDLSVLFGARYDYEEFAEDGFFQFSPTPIDPASLARNSSATDYDAFLPKLGLEYRVGADTTVSAVVQRGYRAGGSGIAGDNTVFEFDPEFTTNYELALRSVLLDGRVTFNANAFYVDWEDQQVLVPLGDPSGLLFRTDNAGSSELYGLEADVTAQLTDSLRLRAGIGLLETEFTDFGNAQTGEDFTGNSFSQAPGFTGNLAVSYQHPSGLFANGDARFQSSSFSDPQNFIAQRVDGYEVVNMQVGYRAENWRIALFARNLFDEDYLLRIRNVATDTNPLNDEANVGAPQVFGAEVRFDL